MSDSPKETPDEESEPKTQSARLVLNEEDGEVNIVIEGPDQEGTLQKLLLRAKEEFLTAPEDKKGPILVFLVVLSQKCGIPISDLGIDDEIDKTLDDETTRMFLMEQFPRHLVRAAIFKQRHGYFERDFQTEITLMEAICSKDPKPTYLMSLAFAYSLIGRIDETMALNRKAAEQDTRFITPYFAACIEHKRFEEAIAFYEEKKPSLSENDQVLLREAYSEQAMGVRHIQRLLRIYGGTFPEDHENLRKAKELALPLYESSRAACDEEHGTLPDPKKIQHVLAYARILGREAYIIERDRSENKSISADSVGLRMESLAIIEKLIERLNPAYDRPQIDLLALTLMEYIRSAQHEAIGEPIIKRAISYAQQMLQHEIFKSGHMASAVELSLANLWAIREKIAGHPIEGVQEGREQLIGAACNNDWNTPENWASLEIFAFLSGDEARAEKTKLFGNYLLFLDKLIRIDTFQAGHRSDEKAFFVDADEGVPFEISICFEPLYEALLPKVQAYMEYLQEIAPPEAKIIWRFKRPLSIIAKMLKIKTEKFLDITDIVGFNVEVPSAEDAKTLYEKVKSNMKEDPSPRERQHLTLPKLQGVPVFDITAQPRNESFFVQVQIRTHATEKVIRMSEAHHDLYKIESGRRLSELVDEDMFFYVGLVGKIMVQLNRISKIVRKKKDENQAMTFEEILAIYQYTSI